MRISRNILSPLSNTALFVIVVDSIFLLMVFFYLQISKFIDPPKTAGEFGDMFGGVNTLFSGLAFGGVLLALYYQKKDLKNQQEELKLTRAEMELTRGEVRGQKEVMAEQLSALKRQQFESTFFKMFTLWNEITDNIKFIYEGEDVMGRGSLLPMLYYAGSSFDEELYHMASSLTSKDAIEAYEVFHYNYAHLLGPYFRSMYHIVKYVDESDSSNEEKYKYVRLVRAQLSVGDLGLLLLNCQTQKGKKFKTNIEKYALLKHTPEVFANFDKEVVTDLKKGFEDSAFDRDMVDK